jgi:hypothetical protein
MKHYLWAKYFADNFKRKKTLSANSYTPTQFEFKQISTNEHSYEKENRGDFSLSQVLMILMQFWRAGSYLSLLAEMIGSTLLECFAGRAPGSYGNRASFKYLQQVPLC